MSDDQDGCEWLNVSSSTGLPGQLRTKRPLNGKRLCESAGVVICLERGVDLHMAQMLPLPLLVLTVSCFCKIQIGFTFLVPAHRSPG